MVRARSLTSLNPERGINDTWFGTIASGNKAGPLYVSLQERMKHMALDGSPAAYANFLAQLILDDLGERRGVVLLDLEGSVAEKVLQRFPPYRLANTTVIDPGNVYGQVPLAPFDTADVDENSELLDDLVAILSPTADADLQMAIRKSIRACLSGPRPCNFADLRQFLTDKNFRNIWLARSCADNAEFVVTSAYKALEKNPPREALALLDLFLDDASMKFIVDHHEKAYDLSQPVQGGALIVRLSPDVISPRRGEVIAKLILARLNHAANLPENGIGDRTPLFVYVIGKGIAQLPSVQSALQSSGNGVGYICCGESSETRAAYLQASPGSDGSMQLRFGAKAPPIALQLPQAQPMEPNGMAGTFDIFLAQSIRYGL